MGAVDINNKAWLVKSVAREQKYIHTPWKREQPGLNYGRNIRKLKLSAIAN
jgi:hypothetical protein